MVGFESDIPTLFVGSSHGPGTFGKIGIGTTNPTVTLDVNGDLNFSGELLQNGQEFKNSPWKEKSNNIFYSAGKVGIGTTDPEVELDVAGTIKATTFTGDGSGLNNIQGAWSTNDDDELYFSNANVGIGTDNPNYALLHLNKEELGNNQLLAFSTKDGTYNPRV
ncbi:MAG: hypothetical protein U9N85_04835 [Bacteroidota bacterium]|nr:hypothetical protein [Bacteroidota bacterium]